MRNLLIGILIGFCLGHLWVILHLLWIIGILSILALAALTMHVIDKKMGTTGK